MSWISLSLLLTSALVGPGTCSMVNRTIDDQNGDEVTGKVPVYAPAGGWAQGSQCSNCGVSISSGVDPGKLFNGTWHDTTVRVNGSAHTISMNFTGSAVYVFNMIANKHGDVSTETHLIFSIDGERVGRFDHVPDNTMSFLYRVPVYTNSSLPHGEHNLQIAGDGSQLSLILFDYVVYTTKADNSSATAGTAKPRASSETTTTSSKRTFTSSSTPSLPTAPMTIRSSISLSSYPTITFLPPPATSYPEAETSTPSSTPLQHGGSHRLAIVAGLTAALSFLCGMVSLAIIRTRKSIMPFLCRVQGWGRGRQGRSRVYPAGSPSSSTHSSLDVNFSDSRSALARPRSPSRLPSTPPYAFLRDPPPVHQCHRSPVIHPVVPTLPPKHSIDVPRSAVSSTRTGTDHSSGSRSGSISELRKELRSLREKLAELQSPCKHRLRLADAHSAGHSEAGVPVTLETLQEDV